jgi:AraC family transcriptional regulator of adaptative response/methylated-DNA-[protein]-cysteine methyltransferase
MADSNDPRFARFDRALRLHLRLGSGDGIGYASSSRVGSIVGADDAGAEFELRYGTGPTPIGPALAARSPRGLCALFLGSARDCLSDLAVRFPRARRIEDPAAVRPDLEALLDPADGARIHDLDLRGTEFQRAVWRALLKIEAGRLSTYSRLASTIGRPRATRAVANAVGRNPVSVLIPCHRVIRNDGSLGGYRWGTERKRALLALELDGVLESRA